MVWKTYGACAHGRAEGIDFFPDPKAGRLASEPAKAVCAHCWVRAQCLDAALHHDESGIWGGTTEKERRIIKALYVRRKKALARSVCGL